MTYFDFFLMAPRHAIPEPEKTVEELIDEIGAEIQRLIDAGIVKGRFATYTASSGREYRVFIPEPQPHPVERLLEQHANQMTVPPALDELLDSLFPIAPSPHSL